MAHLLGNWIEQSHFRRGLITLFVLVGLLACFNTLLHYIESGAQAIDLVLPPLMALVSFGSALVVWLRPQYSLAAIRLFIASAIIAMTLPAWACTITAYLDPQVRLVDVYPPISSFLLVLTIIILVLFPYRQAIVLGLLVWLANALPLISYLLSHSEELWSPRGKEILVAFGPLLLLVILSVPYIRLFGRQFEALREGLRTAHQAAMTDDLTQLANRRAAEQRLKHLLDVNQPFGLLTLDIDHFKQINDNLGHQVGDQVLRDLAQRLNQVVRKGDLVTRWGGEEFLVISPEIDNLGLANLAERIHRSLAQRPFRQVGGVTASIGICLWRPGQALQALLQRLDQALYSAKAKGRNRTEFAGDAEVATSARELIN